MNLLQEGALHHFSFIMCHYLEQMIGIRLIGRGDLVSWPTCPLELIASTSFFRDISKITYSTSFLLLLSSWSWAFGLQSLLLLMKLFKCCEKHYTLYPLSFAPKWNSFQTFFKLRRNYFLPLKTVINFFNSFKVLKSYGIFLIGRISSDTMCIASLLN